MIRWISMKGQIIAPNRIEVISRKGGGKGDWELCQFRRTMDTERCSVLIHDTMDGTFDHYRCVDFLPGAHKM